MSLAHPTARDLRAASSSLAPALAADADRCREHRRWLTAMGRQSALAHTAHLLCEMYVRQKELMTDDAFRMPLTQAKLADTLGLSAVHTSRVLRELREGGFVEWQGDRVTVKDWQGLKELGEFDATYLSGQNEPR